MHKQHKIKSKSFDHSVFINQSIREGFLQQLSQNGQKNKTIKMLFI